MPRRAPCLAIAVLLVALASPAAAGNLVQVRVGNHPDFTRVVFEFDAPTGYRIERRAEGVSENTVVVTLQAASRPRHIDSKSQGVESVAVAPADGEAVARIVTRKSDLPIKEMILADPPRVVLDLMLPQRAPARAAAKPRKTAATASPAVEKKAATPTAEPAPKPSAPEPRRSVAATQPPRAVPPAPVTEPEALELAPEPAPPVVAEAPNAAQPSRSADEGEAAVVPPPLEPPVATADAPAGADAGSSDAGAAEPEAADTAAQPLQLADATPTREPATEIPAGAAPSPAAEASDAEPAATAQGAAPEDATRSLEDDQLWAESHPGEGLAGAAPPPEPAPAAMTTEPAAAAPAAEPAGGPPSWLPGDLGSWLPAGLDPVTLGAVAGGVLVLLLVVFLVMRGRRALPNDMDVTSLAGSDGDDERVPAGGFAMDGPLSGLRDPSDDFESAGAAADDEDKPIESVQAPSPGAGLFDDTSLGKEATTMQNEDMSMTHGTSEAQTQIGVGSGLAGMAGDSDLGGVVKELERRMTLMEQRLEEANEARERLERQVSAQSEELRVQRAAIARTQRALRGLNRSDEDQATEPALRDPAGSPGRQ